MNKKSFTFAIFALTGALLLGACASAGSPPSPSLAPATAAPAAADPTQAPPATAAATADQQIPDSGGPVTFQVAKGSAANYRVREQLVKLNFPSDAVGKTGAVSGQITVLPDGSVDAQNSKFTVDVSTLVSDESRRDGFVSRNILDTGQFPQVVFVPTQLTGLNGIPQPGEQVSFQMTGDLTVKDVTHPVTWDVTGTINNDGTASADATTSFTFEDFGLSQPRVPVVLSVVDQITLETSLQLQEVKP